MCCQDSELSFTSISIGVIVDDPQADTLDFIGALKLTSTSAILKGTEVQLSVKIDASRVLSIMAYLVRSGEVVPLELTLPDTMAVRKRQLLVQERIWHNRRTLNELSENITVVSNDALYDQCQQIENELVELDLQLSMSMCEPDEIDRIIDREKKVKESIITLTQKVWSINESSFESKGQDSQRIEAQRKNRVEQEIEQTLPDIQDSEEAEAIERLRQEVTQLEQKLPREQKRLIDYAERRIARIRAQKLDYWIPYFDYLKSQRVTLSNQDAADRFIEEGEMALQNKDTAGLRHTVLRLYELLPESQEKARDMKKLKPGLDTY